MSFIELKDVKKIYKMGEVEISAADAMSFTAEKGEFIVIVGPSGAGKTTLLNMLGGMDCPTSGSIQLDGEEISSYNQSQLTEYRRRDVGFVFQFYNLVQNLTAIENVELACEISAHPLKPEKVLEQVGLEKRANNFPAQLSGGEQQRVAIARALAKNPKLLLCDEPTGALDFKTGKHVLCILQEASFKHGRTVAVVTHNRAFIDIANRVIEVNSGKITANYTNESPLSAEVIEW